MPESLIHKQLITAIRRSLERSGYSKGDFPTMHRFDLKFVKYSTRGKILSKVVVEAETCDSLRGDTLTQLSEMEEMCTSQKRTKAILVVPSRCRRSSQIILNSLSANHVKLRCFPVSA